MLKQFLLNNWENLINDKKPQIFNIVTLTSCQEDYGNDLVLLFVENSNTPQYVLKVVRDARYNFKLKREKFALATLTKAVSINKLVPVPFSSGELNGRYYFIQRGVAGKNLNNLLFTTGFNDKIIELLKQSILLLCNINTAHEQLSEIQNNSKVSGLNFLLLPEREYSSVGITPVDIKKIVSFYDLFYTLGRIYFLHGDYWPGNILVDEHRIKVTGVIDWEYSTPCSAVPTDIIWLLINTAHLLFGRIRTKTPPLIESFKWGFFTSGEHNEIFANLFRLYISKINLSDRRLFRPLLLLCLLDMAMREKIAYGQHYTMDHECLELLRYAMHNESYMDNL